MPDTSLLIRIGRQPSGGLSALMLLTSGLMLAGCSGGDFGRTREDFRNDDMHRWLGAEATGSVGMTASQFQLTENERQLRDLAYPLIEPPHSRPAWKSVFGDYQPLPSPWRQAPVLDRTAHGAAPFAFLVLLEPERRRARRHHPLRAVLRQRRQGARSRPQAERQPLPRLGTVAARTRRCGRAHAGEHADRGMGAAVPGAAGFLLSLGARAAGDPGARRHGRRWPPRGPGGFGAGTHTPRG